MSTAECRPVRLRLGPASGVLVALALVVFSCPTPLPAATSKPDQLLTKCQEALRAGALGDAMGEVLTRRKSPTVAAELDALAEALAPLGDRAVSSLRSLASRDSPAAASMAVELLWRLAERNRLSDGRATRSRPRKARSKAASSSSRTRVTRASSSARSRGRRSRR